MFFYLNAIIDFHIKNVGMVNDMKNFKHNFLERGKTCTLKRNHLEQIMKNKQDM